MAIGRPSAEATGWSSPPVPVGPGLGHVRGVWQTSDPLTPKQNAAESLASYIFLAYSRVAAAFNGDVGHPELLCPGERRAVAGWRRPRSHGCRAARRAMGARLC